MEKANDELILLDFWVSSYCMRVKIALAEKGIQFETKEEDLLGKKSEVLLNSNPIYKQVPVLLHNQKPISESLVILNYIEETWPEPPLLPSCPYERAQIIFWAEFIDKKVFGVRAKMWTSKGEELERVVKEWIDALKVVERSALGEKDYFGGERLGFLDIVAIPITAWFYTYEEYGGFKIEEECPKISAWMKRCWERDSVLKMCPDPHKLYEFTLMVKKKFGF